MGLNGFIKNWIHHDINTRHALQENERMLKKLQRLTGEIRLHQRMDFLRDKTLSATDIGISDERYADCEVIVSLTTFGKRIYDVYLAIESIMQGTIKPNRIILWLSEQEFEGKTLPKTLEMQQKRGLEIRFCEDIGSYTKLLPALHSFPNACIITIDDDLMYEYDIVERLVHAHEEDKNAVCACRVHRVKLDGNNKLKSYMKWDLTVVEGEKNSPFLFPTGVGGVLYPPNCFSAEVFNKDVYSSICPYADDIWFYAMELLNDIKVVHVYTGYPEGYYLLLPSSSIDALSKENTNVVNCRNDVQINAVFEKYNLYDKLLSYNAN